MSQGGYSLSVVVNSVSGRKGSIIATPTYVPNTDWTISFVISEKEFLLMRPFHSLQKFANASKGKERVIN
jgi:hypothetical protein